MSHQLTGFQYNFESFILWGGEEVGVEPNSFGFLDSEKPGGGMSMIVLQSFYTELNTGGSVNITFQVLLRNTS
ncbi:MAG: hypothetical protein QW733_00870 [Desulfurococcaceae archaeon]